MKVVFASALVVVALGVAALAVRWVSPSVVKIENVSSQSISASVRLADKDLISARLGAGATASGIYIAKADGSFVITCATGQEPAQSLEAAYVTPGEMNWFVVHVDGCERVVSLEQSDIPFGIGRPLVWSAAAADQAAQAHRQRVH